jgi:hypothetical protein
VVAKRKILRGHHIWLLWLTSLLYGAMREMDRVTLGCHGEVVQTGKKWGARCVDRLDQDEERKGLD